MSTTHVVEFELPNAGTGPDPFAPSETDVGDAFDQPVRFGLLGELHDFVGRMPAAVVLDRRAGEITYRHEGDTPGDRPGVDELPAAVDAL